MVENSSWLLLGRFSAWGGLLGLAWFVMSTFRHSDACQQAVARAQSNPAIVGELGAPIKPGWFASGEIEVNGSTGKARIEIPLSGPKNHGTLSVDSEKIAGQWHFHVLQFRVSGHPESIDLLIEPSENSTNPQGETSPP